MEINNLEQIKPLLNFETEDDFYFLQIIKRRKENPEMNSNSSVIKTYYISSIEYLEKKMPEIVLFCQKSNARACISLNRRSYKKIAFHTLKKVTEQICNDDFKSVRNAYDKACGAYNSETDKRWIIDLDGEMWIPRSIDALKNLLIDVPPEGDKFITLLDTPNGKHMIAKPFHLGELNSKKSGTFLKMHMPDVHKNNPTILYYKCK